MFSPCLLPQLEFISRNHCPHSMQCWNHAAMRPNGQHCPRAVSETERSALTKHWSPQTASNANTWVITPCVITGA